MDSSGQPDIAASSAEERPPRSHRFMLVEIARDGGPPLRARVRDLSEEGLGGVVSGNLQQGEQIVTTLIGIGPVRATVAWVEGRRFGAKFVERIDPRLCKFAPSAPTTNFRVADLHKVAPNAKRPPLRPIS